MPYYKKLTVLLMLLMFSSIFAKVKKPGFYISYSKEKISTIKNYDQVFLEAAFYTSEDVKILKKQNKKVYGYISLTEVSEHNEFLYNRLKHYLLSRNNNWNSHYINIANSQARQILIEEITKILEKGFDGLLLDNLDNVSIHGPYKALQTSLIKLITALKEKHPSKDLIQNGGLFLLQNTHSFIHGVLIESVYTDYSFSNSTYKLRNTQEAKTKKEHFINFIKKYKLHGFVVEYAVDSLNIQKIYKNYRSNKQVSVIVTNINLANNAK